jgi:hypothetical protein
MSCPTLIRFSDIVDYQPLRLFERSFQNATPACNSSCCVDFVFRLQPDLRLSTFAGAVLPVNILDSSASLGGGGGVKVDSAGNVFFNPFIRFFPGGVLLSNNALLEVAGVPMRPAGAWLIPEIRTTATGCSGTGARKHR